MTVALPKLEGGLGLIGVEDQYNALTQNLMLWILAIGDHPLRRILQNHIKKVLERRWGTPDLSWLVSKCGTLNMGGSAPWQRICHGWASLKKNLFPGLPANREEWGALPLWRPHRNHLQGNLVRCSTLAQKLLRANGFEFMRDLQHPQGEFLTWIEGSPDPM